MRFSRIQINNFYNLKDVDLDLSSGSALIVGPNGSGKSNIIKCVEGLVKLLTYDVKFGSGTWSERPDKALIKIQARLSRKEVEIMCRLHAIFITCDVILIANMISQLIFDVWRKSLEPLDSAEKAGVFDSIIPSGVSDTLRNHVVTLNTNMNEVITKERILQICIEDLACDKQLISGFFNSDVDWIELLAMPMPRKAADIDVYGKPRTDFRKELSISGDVELPVLVAAKKKAVIDVLNKIFYDSNMEEFGLEVSFENAAGGGERQEMSLADAIGHLVDPKLLTSKHIYIEIKLSNRNCGKYHRVNSCNARDTISDGMKFERYESFWLSTQFLLNNLNTNITHGMYNSGCLGNLSRRDLGPTNLLRKFLKESLCILPQDRGIFSETDDWTLSLSAVESQLVTWKLSEYELERQQFMKIKEEFKALSGLDIEAVQLYRENALLKKQLIDKSQSPSSILSECYKTPMTREVEAAAYDNDVQLKKKGDHLMKVAPRGLRYVGLVATRTLDGEGKTQRSIRVPLSDCSGGEKECLMVMTAIQWPTADTVFLDEPGHSLHPPQQAQLRRFLETQRRPDQAIVTVTHAVEFISTVSLASLYHMSCTGMGFTPFKLAVREEAVTLDDHPGTLPPCPTQVAVDQNVMTMLMGPDMRKAFFATGLYFVEGETDKKVLNSLRYYMLKYARNIRESSINFLELSEALEILEMDSWDILALGGCGNAVKAYKAAKALMIPCAVILDEDTITVKHGKRLKPFTQTNWEKSNLYRALKVNKGSLNDASEILGKLKSAFEDSEQEEMHEKARQILEEYGFWIWEGDIEGIIFDDKKAREHFRELDEFMNLVLPDEIAGQVQDGSRSLMPLQAALENFDQKLRDPLEVLLDKLQVELSASRDAMRDACSKGWTTPVTVELQGVLGKIGKLKQAAIQHDQYCKKKTDRKPVSRESSEETSSLDLVSEKSSEETSSLNPVSKKSSEETSSLEPNRDKAFWNRVKKELHDHGGWMKIPEDMMQTIIVVCLNDGLESDNSLARFCKFMKRHQYRGRPHKQHLPEDIMSRILPHLMRKEESFQAAK